MKTPHVRTLISMAVLGTALGLAGCGSSHHDQSKAPATPSTPSAAPDQGSSSSASSSSKPASPVPAAYPVPKWNTPLSDYIPLSNSNAVMFQYYAHTGIAPDYKTIASNFDSHYMDTSDVFTKHKIIKEIKPVVDQRIAAAKAHPYVYWPMYGLELGNYSFKRHGFSMQGTMLISGGYAEYTDFKDQRFTLNIRNANDFTFLPVKNQKLAQKMEHWISNDDAVYVQPYLFINGASLDHHQVHATCTRINIYGPHKELLMSYTPLFSDKKVSS